MSIIEILTNDHIAIRLLDRCFINIIDLDSFKSLHSFIIELHAKIEDEYLFPIYIKYFKEDEVEYLVKRIAADHLLLKKLGSKVIKYGEECEEDLFKNRVNRYMQILIDHNKSEEGLLFPLWKNIDEELRREADEKSLNLVNKYGYGKYTSILKAIGKNIK